MKITGCVSNAASTVFRSRVIVRAIKEKQVLSDISMKKTILVDSKRKISVYYCDNCGKEISEDGGKNFKKGAYQTGVNREGGIGTWCGRKCERNYKIK